MALSDEDLDRLIASVAERRSSGGGLSLAHWSKQDWHRALAGASHVGLDDGEALIERNAPGDDLYFLLSGRLEVSIPQSASLTITPIARIEPGSVVGEIAFLDHSARSANVWSRGRSVLLRLSQEAFTRLRAEEPRLAADLAVALGEVVARRLRRAIGAAARG